MKKILFFLIFAYFLNANDNFNNNEDETFELIRANIADFYYRFIDNATFFLYNKSNYQYIKKHNKLKLYIDNSIDKDGNIKSSISIRANIKLPRIKKLFLTFDKESKNITKDEKISSLEEEKQKSRVGLKYFFLRKKDKNVYAKLGLRFRLKNSKIYLKFGADKIDKILNEINTYSYFNEYYYITTKVFKTELGINFEKRLDNFFTIGEANAINLKNSSHFNETTIYLSNTLFLNQYLTSNSFLTYWSTLSSTLKEKKLQKDTISFNIKYHYNLKKWIFTEIIPKIIKNFQSNKTSSYLYVNFGFIF